MVRMSKKKLNCPKQQTIKVDFDLFTSGIKNDLDQTVLPLKDGYATYNFNCDNGVLTDGMGVRVLRLPLAKSNLSQTRTLQYVFTTRPTDFSYYRYFERYTNDHENRILVYDNDGDFSYCQVFSNYEYFQKIQSNFNQTPCDLNYNYNNVDYMFFSSPTDVLSKWTLGGDVEQIENGPYLTSMCVYNSKFFGTPASDTNTIFVVDSSNPADWTTTSNKSFKITFNDTLGKANKLVVFNNYLYVFRDYGITRITCYEGSVNYTLSTEFVSSNYIYERTIAFSDDKIVFTTGDGVYIFDGASAKKLDLHFENLFKGIDNRKARADVFNGKYYLACKTTLEQTHPTEINCSYNSTLFEIDLNKSKSNSLLYGEDIVALKTIKDEGLEKLLILKYLPTHSTICELTFDGCESGIAIKKVWQSPFTDLGYNKQKHLKSVTLTCTQNCTLEVETENEKETFSLAGSATPQKIQLNLKGVKVRVGFIAQVSSIKITRPELEIKL